MIHTNDFIFYAITPSGVSKQLFQDFTTFALETGILGGAGSILEEHSLNLAAQLFSNKSRVVATNLSIKDTQMPFKQRGKLEDILRYINSNYVYAPYVHPLLVGITSISVVDVDNRILDVKGVIINTSVVHYAQAYEPLVEAYTVNNEQENQEALGKLVEIVNKDPENIALIMPIRDAINQYEIKSHTATLPVKAKRKPRKKERIDDTYKLLSCFATIMH